MLVAVIKDCEMGQKEEANIHKWCRKVTVLQCFATIMTLRSRDAYQLGKLN